MEYLPDESMGTEIQPVLDHCFSFGNYYRSRHVLSIIEFYIKQKNTLYNVSRMVSNKTTFIKEYNNI